MKFLVAALVIPATCNWDLSLNHYHYSMYIKPVCTGHNCFLTNHLMFWQQSWNSWKLFWVQKGFVFFVCLQQRGVFTQIFLDRANCAKYVILKTPFLKVQVLQKTPSRQTSFPLLLHGLSFKPSLACDNSYYVNTHTQVFIENKYIPTPDFQFHHKLCVHTLLIQWLKFSPSI